MRKPIILAASLLLIAGCGENPAQKAAKEAAINLRRTQIQTIIEITEGAGMTPPDTTMLMMMSDERFNEFYNSVTKH